MEKTFIIPGKPFGKQRPRVTVNGKYEVTKVSLDEEVVDPEDVEMLEDLVMVAVNSALRQVEEASKASMSRLTGGMGGGFSF